MQPTNAFTIRCEQCDVSIGIPRDQASEVKAFLSRQGWEPYGIHVSIGIAVAGDADGRYACGRCSRELTVERLDRLVDQVLREVDPQPCYDFIYPGGQATLKVYGRGWEIPLHVHDKDEQTRATLRQAINDLLERPHVSRSVAAG